MNFGSMLQLKNAWNTFIGNHPKFPRFLRAAGSCISKDTIIEIKVTTAEGRVLETNLKVKESDIDLLKSLAKLGFLLLFHCFLWYNKSSEKGAEKHMAGNSKDSKILVYKDMINQLNKTISTQTELIQSLQKTLEADRLEKENLRQQIEYLTKKLFGTSSEKRKDIDGQLNLFDEAEQLSLIHI